MKRIALMVLAVVALSAVACENAQVDGAPDGKHGDIRAIGYDVESASGDCADFYSGKYIHGIGNAVGRTEWTYSGQVCGLLFEELP